VLAGAIMRADVSHCAGSFDAAAAAMIISAAAEADVVSPATPATAAFCQSRFRQPMDTLLHAVDFADVTTLPPRYDAALRQDGQPTSRAEPPLPRRRAAAAATPAASQRRHCRRRCGRQMMRITRLLSCFRRALCRVMHLLAFRRQLPLQRYRGDIAPLRHISQAEGFITPSCFLRQLDYCQV